MEADDVYSQLNDKISDLQSKIDDNSSRFDALRSDLSDLKSSVIDMKSSSGGSGDDLKGALDQLRSDMQALKDSIATLQQSASQKPDASATSQKFDDIQKKIEDANAASERKYQDQQGMLGKLAAQAEQAGKMIGDWPKTVGDMVGKAVDDGKKEILGIWENGKKDIMNGISDLTTPLIKSYISDAKTEIKDELREMITGQIKEADAEKPKTLALTEDEFDERVTKIAKLAVANTPA